MRTVRCGWSGAQDVGLVDACLEVVRKHWQGGIHGVYAHSSSWDVQEGQGQGKWVFDDVISPGDYASHCQRWLQAGVQVIGGCCGTRPDHIALLPPHCAACNPGSSWFMIKQQQEDLCKPAL